MTMKEFLIITIMLVIFFIGWIGQAYVEMNTFNRFSDQDATLIEAMFSNLRVTTCGY